MEKRRFGTIFKKNFKRKIIHAKIKKSAANAPFATFMQPLQCDSRLSDAKHKSITLAANSSPQRKLCLPEKTQCFAQLLTFKSHPWFTKTKLSCEASFEFQQFNVWKRSFRARHPSNSTSWMYESEAFVRGFLRIPTVECMKTKLSCEASFEFQELKTLKRSFCARPPSNSKSWRCESEAFVRGFLQIPRLREVNASLQCSSSNAQSVSTDAKHNSTASSKKRKSLLEPLVPLRAQTEQEPNAKRIRPQPSRKRANFSLQRKHTEAPFTRKNTMFRATPNIQIASMIHENKAFVRGILRIPTVQCMKAKLSCEASFKFH